MWDSKRDTDVYNSLLDSVGEGEGGIIWENSIETCILSYPSLPLFLPFSLSLFLFLFYLHYAVYSTLWSSQVLTCTISEERKNKQTNKKLAWWMNFFFLTQGRVKSSQDAILHKVPMCASWFMNYLERVPVLFSLCEHGIK